MKSLLNIICNKKVKYSILFIFLLFLYTAVCAVSYVDAVSEDISNSVFRLHVIANSDTTEDQELKYKVRDAVLEYMNSISKDITSKEEVIQIANDHKEDFKEIALSIIHENGYDYTVNINIGNFPFPTKTYGDISLPAGTYDALRIEIGSAKGQNWWCVMFPPLCFVDVSSGIVPDESKEMIQNNLTEEEYNLVSDDSPSIQFKFKLVELFQNVMTFTAKK